MSIGFAKQYVYKNIKTGKYISIKTLKTSYSTFDILNVEKATKFDNLTYHPYLPKLLNVYIKVPYNEELRKQKLKELNKNWFQKLKTFFKK